MHLTSEITLKKKKLNFGNNLDRSRSEVDLSHKAEYFFCYIGTNFTINLFYILKKFKKNHPNIFMCGLILKISPVVQSDFNLNMQFGKYDFFSHVVSS